LRDHVTAFGLEDVDKLRIALFVSYTFLEKPISNFDRIGASNDFGYALGMSSIFDLPSVRARVSRVSVDEYHRQSEYNENGKRTELIRGFVIEKTSKSPLHETIARRLLRLINLTAGPGVLVSKDSPLTLRYSEPEPDLFVADGDENRFAKEHPHTARLVVEVAVTSADEDRELAGVYAEASVTEYWIVLAMERCVEVYRLPEAGQYQERRVYRLEEDLISSSLPALQVSLRKLFSDL
jgi:Uma2 family endonuclease